MKKSINYFLAVISTVLLTSAAFAQDIPDPYAPADAATKQILDETNALISDEKYESAFNHLSKDNTNEYIIAKKIEICDNYFASSIMHQMFGFKDLEAGENLNDIRKNGGSFNSIVFDPVAIVTDYEAKNNTSAILEKSLGDYYMSVYNHYQGNWNENDQDVLAHCIQYYDLAYGKNCYTVQSLDDFSYACLLTKDYSKAAELLEKELNYQSDPNIHYNLAITYINMSNTEKAASEAEQAALGYDTNLDYKIDAYLLCADCMLAGNNVDKAKQYAEMAASFSENDYRIFDEYLEIYLVAKDYDNASKYADKLFAVAPENPSATQMIFKRYYNKKEYAELENSSNEISIHMLTSRPSLAT